MARGPYLPARDPSGLKGLTNMSYVTASNGTGADSTHGLRPLVFTLQRPFGSTRSRDLSRTARLHDAGRYSRGDQNTTSRNGRLGKSFLRSRGDGKPQRHHGGGRVFRLGLSALRQ